MSAFGDIASSLLAKSSDEEVQNEERKKEEKGIVAKKIVADCTADMYNPQYKSKATEKARGKEKQKDKHDILIGRLEAPRGGRRGATEEGGEEED